MEALPQIAGDSVRLLDDKEEVEALIALFEATAEKEGWQPGGQLRAHLNASTYFAAYVGDELAGGMQIVLPAPGEPFPFHAVWPEASAQAIEPCRVAHVAVLAIRAERRGHQRLFWPLLIELWRMCVRQCIQAIVIEATPPMLARYRRLGFELCVIGPLRSHWGEDCYLCRADATMVAGAVLTRAVRSPCFRSLVVQAMRPLVETSGAAAAGASECVGAADCAPVVSVPS